jgi:hypothetical protein
MPIELGIWRIDSKFEKMDFAPLDFEQRLEDILDHDIRIANPNWMIIGRQVRTTFDKFIDLLAIDRSGNLVVLELKRDKTYRDIVAQVLDYGSFVHNLGDDEIAKIYHNYISKYHPESSRTSLDEVFSKRFLLKQMPDELNESHELVIVASSLDYSTERVVNYLSRVHGVNINAIFFKVFKDEEKEYLTRTWLQEPSLSEAEISEDSSEWNGEYYMSFGINENRDWDEAVQYGFISGGGGSWYSGTLNILEPGARIWVNVPGTGYVGVGIVKESPVDVDDFLIKNDDGKTVPLISLPVKAAGMHQAKDDPEKAERLVRVEWVKTVPLNQAIKEKGFFGNQNTVAKPKAQKWNHTVNRLKERFCVD